MTAPAVSPALWPAQLNDRTPLPYRLWRVMDVLAGVASLRAAAAALALNEAQVQEALVQVQTLLARQQEQSAPLSDDHLAVITQALVAALGPIGQLNLDDALDALEERGAVPTAALLIREAALALDEPHRQLFFQRLRQRGLL